MTYRFDIMPSNLPSLSIHSFILSFHHIRYITLMLCYAHSFVRFFFPDVMHEFTIHKELGQLPIRISLVQGRFAVSMWLWQIYDHHIA